MSIVIYDQNEHGDGGVSYLFLVSKMEVLFYGIPRLRCKTLLAILSQSAFQSGHTGLRQ
jgi:hypothetical protein